MGTSKRADLANTNQKVPGPGVYELGSKVGEGPKYVMGQKLASSMGFSNKVPGPGTYMPEYND